MIRGEEAREGATLSRRKRLLFSVASAAFAVLFSVLAIEVVMRVVLYRQARLFDNLRTEIMQQESSEELVLVNLLMPSPAEEQVFRLRPNVRGPFVGEHVRINSAGFRGAEWPVEKPAGVKRIAVLGDSVAFGWGVAEEETFAARLEAGLNTAAGETTGATRYEVLNFSVPASNTVMQLATLKHDVLKFGPDVVILCLVNNDAELPNFIRIKPQIWSLKKSFIVEAIRDQMVGRKWGDTAREAIGGIADFNARAGAEAQVSGFRPELVPKEYQFLVGQEVQAKALREMAELCRERQVTHLCLVYENIAKLSDESLPLVENNVEARLAKMAGWSLCSPSEELAEYLKREGVGRFDLWVSPKDIHPNGVAHQIIAKKLLRCVDQFYPEF